MPTWTPLDSDPDTGDSIPVAFLELEGRTEELRTGFGGSTPPADPEEGQAWVDTSEIPHRVYRYLRIDGGSPSWQPMGPLSRLPASLNGDPSTTGDREAPFEHLALRLENRSDLPAPAATNAGLVVYRTGDGEVFVADEPVSGGWKGLVSVAKDQSRDTVELALADAHLDSTHPPTPAAKGVLAGLLFDATDEKATFAAIVPPNWQGGTDLALRVFQVLDGAESPGAAIEWSGEVRTLVPAQDKATKAASALEDATTSIGADADGIDEGGGPHLTELALAYDDPANPVSPGCLVLVTLWRKTVGGSGKAGGTVVFRVDLAYVQTPRHERA